MSKRWIVRYDMRAPAFGPPAPELYRAALEQCAWADARGVDAIVISEHHGSSDGYLPSALTFAAAVAARTEHTRIRIGALILPLLDPIRAAEDTLIVDQISGGRVEVAIGLGYVPAEFAMMGLDMADRVALIEEKTPVFTAALTGEPVTYRGARFRVTPTPVQRPRPPVLVGGGAAATARRAARLSDGFMAMTPDPAIRKVYEDECARLGKTPRYDNPSGPLFVHVANEPDAAWARIAPHAMHEMNEYGRWASESGTETGFVPMTDTDALRAFGMHAVVTPEACIELWRSLPDDANLIFHPLMGGLAPELAWESLELFDAVVRPAVLGTGAVSS
jgi:alkanesulfonate monooxygenase SsuD/methylene tetrahydromethanopterin reductase-like flavin-dependent oxidoreductase (luciferase family)